MNAFQLLSISLLVALAVLTLVLASRRRLSRRAAILWSILWAMAAAAILKPGLTRDVAHLLGIDRGADFVFYCAILGMFAGFFVGFVRLRKLEHNLTLLVRKLAIQGAVEPESGGERSADSSPPPGATSTR